MRLFLLALLSICLASCAPRPDAFGLESGSFRASFDHYAINVDDVDASVAFYQRVFDLPEVYDGTGKENIRWLALGNGMSLHIIESDRSQLRLQKGIHLAISLGDFASFVARLRTLDVPFESWQGAAMETNGRPDGVQQVYLQDPDGYWIEVNDGRSIFGKPPVKP
ncbi:hypothetical protein LEM8419_01560 [Neolewinella maritima]|uniref:VOC domain-containing protein n=1 Tax=Neolewinella maritima TaxID=1383882 RepID=A0ABM9AZY4_9BACT|nr:VOC family protein [Neolewinella maritima]CAH1000407.1 hypothetical protein LEM8419_01560 [Neolewinella maritima]